MVISINVFKVRVGQEADVERLFARAAALIATLRGYRGCRLHRQRGEPLSYLSYVEWASEEAVSAAARSAELTALIEQYPLREPVRRRRFEIVLDVPASEA